MVYSLRSACFCGDAEKDSGEFFGAEKRVSEDDWIGFFCELSLSIWMR